MKSIDHCIKGNELTEYLNGVFQIAGRPGSRHFRCLFRVTYVPKDSYDLLKQDPIAFEYFYMQVRTINQGIKIPSIKCHGKFIRN